MVVNRIHLKLMYSVYIVAGALMIWAAEKMAAGAKHPFSYWYWAFAAYSVYGIVAGFYMRRRFTRELASADLPPSGRYRRWLARELLGMCCAISPIVGFVAARALLKMPVSLCVPWYVLGFLLLFLWRPSDPLAMDQIVADKT